MIRSPVTSGAVGYPVIGPVLLKNRMAAGWVVKLSRPGGCALACAVPAATALAAPPASAAAASAPKMMRVLRDIGSPSKGSVLLES